MKRNRQREGDAQAYGSAVRGTDGEGKANIQRNEAVFRREIVGKTD
jgi:hypothetical protein